MPPRDAPARAVRRPGLRLLVAWTAALAVLLAAAPLARRVERGITAFRFLVEFLTEGRRPWLSRATPAPAVEPLGTAPLDAALWRPRQAKPRPALVLVHGLTPAGRRDPRVEWAADRLARTGFAVAVPELPGLRAQRLRPDDAEAVSETLRRLAAHPAVRPDPVGVVAVSVGLAPVALAIAEPEHAGRVAVVLALGGYAEARELIRYFTTGAYAFRGVGGRVGLDAALAREFLAANLDLVRDPRDRAVVAAALAGRAAPAPAGPEARAVLAVLANRDPARVDALLEALPPETRTLLDRLSPVRQLAGTRARLLLVHGRGDPAIPFTESLRLAAAAPGRARLVLVGLVEHVEGEAPSPGRLGDLARLWTVAYELLAR
jgi:pimeloyl-ACP methyl ester carboxylesterase